MLRLVVNPQKLHVKCNDLRRLLKLEVGHLFSIRIHHWITGDPPQYQHSHPWSFITVVLWGGYDDVGEGRQTDYVRGPTIRYRSTSWKHSVINVRPNTWSIVITGKAISKWRFWIDNTEVDEKTWGLRTCD